MSSNPDDHGVSDNNNNSNNDNSDRPKKPANDNSSLKSETSSISRPLKFSGNEDNVENNKM